jgi:hypothetical protein
MPCSQAQRPPPVRTGDVVAARAPLEAAGVAPGMALVTFVSTARMKAAAPGAPGVAPRPTPSMPGPAVSLGPGPRLAERRGRLCEHAEAECRERREQNGSDRDELRCVGAVAPRGAQPARVSQPVGVQSAYELAEVAVCPGHSPDGPLCGHGPSWAGKSSWGWPSSHGSLVTNGHGSPLFDLGADVRSRSGRTT